MGLRIGKGEKLSTISDGMTAVAEGVLTSLSAHQLAKKLGVDVCSPLLFHLKLTKVVAVERIICALAGCSRNVGVGGRLGSRDHAVEF